MRHAHAYVHTYVTHAREELPLTYTNLRCIIEIKEVISMYVIRDEDVIETLKPIPGDRIPIHPKVQIAVFVNAPFLYLKKSKLHSPHYTILDTPEGTYFLFSPTHPPYELPITLHNKRIHSCVHNTQDVTSPLYKIPKKLQGIHSYKENYHMILHAPDITEWNPETSIIKPMITFPYMNFIITKRKVLNIKTNAGRPRKKQTQKQTQTNE